MAQHGQNWLWFFWYMSQWTTITLLMKTDKNK